MANANDRIREIGKNDAKPALPKDLSDDIPVISRYGFKITIIGGRPVWEAATEADYRASESQRRGIRAEEVELPFPDDTCTNTGPRSCGGNCWYGGFCKLWYNPQSNYYYCACG